MKRLLLAVLLVSFIMAVFLANAFADPVYPTVFLKEAGVSPGSSGVIHFPVLGNVNVLYGEYDLMIDWDKGGTSPYVPISGFCVENAWATQSNGIVYELIPVADWGENFTKAAWVFSEYQKGNISAQAAQIAIWELVLDTGKNPMTGNGAFYANFYNGYVQEAYDLLNGVTLGSVSSGFAIAHNPVGSTNPKDYQDYIIPVPEPGILILLGISMASIVGLKRWWKD